MDGECLTNNCMPMPVLKCTVPLQVGVVCDNLIQCESRVCGLKKFVNGTIVGTQDKCCAADSNCITCEVNDDCGNCASCDMTTNFCKYECDFDMCGADCEDCADGVPGDVACN